MALEPTQSGSFLTFRVGAQLYALPSHEVSEVTRFAALARVPQGPAALLGLANLRGAVIPVAGLREILGKGGAAEPSSLRAIVLDIGAPVALAVDSVETLEDVGSEQVETRQNALGAEDSEKLTGVFTTQSTRQVAKIIDIKALLHDAFASLARNKAQQHSAAVSIRRENAPVEAARIDMLVTFDVAGQEFALPLESVREILTLPPAVTAVARSEAVVLGMTSVRDSLMPLISLRGLLGFAPAESSTEREKVLVVKVGGTHVGLVADNARAVLAADPARMEPVPPILAARTGGESKIKAVYRGDSGRRLISILSPEQLFRDDVMQRLSAAQRAESTSMTESEVAAGDELIFLVFRLGADEFGLPIDSVVEVGEVPPQLTRVPKTPKFLEGIVNLRGEVVPVIDQRRRFDMPKLERTEARRLVFLKTERHRAAIIVDSVADVLRTPRSTVTPAPDLTAQISRLVHGVINLEKSNRMVLILDPTELLTRAEQGLLENFQAQSKKADA